MAAADGVKVLELAGTSPEYRGLFEAARHVKPLSKTELQEFSVKFREAVDIPPMAEAMVAIEHTHDHLKVIEAAGWQPPKDHPDLDAVHEALLLREHFSELLRGDSEWQQNKVFITLLQESVQAAQNLEEALSEGRPNTAEAQLYSSFSHLATRIEAKCKACHQQFRDVPLVEK